MLSKKLFFSFIFFIFLFFISLNSQELQKIKDYKNKILTQIKNTQQQTNKITLLIQLLEENFANSVKQLAINEKKVRVLEQNIKKEEYKLDILNTSLQKTLNKVHQNFLSFYFLEKIQQNSIIPNFGYFKNYNRNQKVVELLLESDIQVGKNIRKQAEQRNQQLAIWKENKKDIVLELKNLAYSRELVEFDKQQNKIFLKQLKKQQAKDKKTLFEIEKNLKNISKVKNSTVIRQTNNKFLPTYGKIIEFFGQQNPKIPFYHKNGVLIMTTIQEKVRSIGAGEVVFLDNISRYNILIIVDHGQGKLSTYGRITNANIKQGDRIKNNQVIGEVAAYDEQKGVLYFALRKNGIAVNPIEQ